MLSQFDVPDKGNQPNFSVKSNLAQQELTCGKLSISISVIEDSLSIDRSNVKLEVSEFNQDKNEDFPKAPFEGVGNHEVSSEIEVLSENVKYQKWVHRNQMNLLL